MGSRNTPVHIPETGTGHDHAFVSGGRASLPIIIGYLPVAMAFGAAGTSAGLDPTITTGISALVFAGASQFLLLAALTTGSSLPLVIALCAALNMRHLLYGSVLATRIPASRKLHMGLAFGLTDEVFATALNSSCSVEHESRSLWLAGLALGAYIAWVGGTAAGAFLGTALEGMAPPVAEAMGFALPALFLSVTLLNVCREAAIPMLVSIVVAGVSAWSGYTATGIFLGTGAGSLIAWIKR